MLSTLLHHTVWACDCLQTYDIWFRSIFAFFIIDIRKSTACDIFNTARPHQGLAQRIFGSSVTRSLR